MFPQNHIISSPKWERIRGFLFYAVACCSLKTTLLHRLVRMEALVAADANSSVTCQMYSDAAGCSSPSQAGLWIRQLILLQRSCLLSKQNHFKVVTLEVTPVNFHFGYLLLLYLPLTRFQISLQFQVPFIFRVTFWIAQRLFSSLPSLRNLWITFSTLTLFYCLTFSLFWRAFLRIFSLDHPGSTGELETFGHLSMNFWTNAFLWLSLSFEF